MSPGKSVQGQCQAPYPTLNEVDCDEACQDVARTFDFNLEWRQPLHATNPNALPGGYALGACVGPSGSGKSSALARLCDDSLPEAFSWDNEVPVKSQIGSTEY